MGHTHFTTGAARKGIDPETLTTTPSPASTPQAAENPPPLTFSVLLKFAGKAGPTRICQSVEFHSTRNHSEAALANATKQCKHRGHYVFIDGVSELNRTLHLPRFLERGKVLPEL